MGSAPEPQDGDGRWARLRRRKVVQWGLAYAAGAWGLQQGIAYASGLLRWPDQVQWLSGLALLVGLPIAMTLAWYHGDKGEQRVTRIELAVLTVLLLAGGSLVWVYGHRSQPAGVALQTRAGLDSAVPATSIAVLPFEDMSPAKDQAYFSDGVSEDLLNLLAKVPQLQVTARTSSFAFKGKGLGVPEIARQLHVAHVLEGSVQKAGHQVRITVKLVDAATDTQRWSQTWDRKLDDVFKIQDEIAGEVVKALQVRLLGALPSVRQTDPQAYALYLQARELGRHQDTQAFEKSDALYRQVLAIDPSYAPAWAGLSRNLADEPNIAMLSFEEGAASAREAAEKALAIDPDYALAHADLGYIAMTFNNDLPGAAKHFERALLLDPTDLDVLHDAAWFLMYLRRLDESLALHEALARRDPLNTSTLSNLAFVQSGVGRYDASIATCRTLLSLSPGRGTAHYFLGTALLLKGDASAALTAIEQETSEPWRLIGLTLAYHALGRKSDSDVALSELIRKYEKSASSNIAYVYAYRGEADKAFEWLNKAVQYRDPGIPEIVAQPLFARIRSDPRWLPFLRSVGKAPEQLAKTEFRVTLPKEWQVRG